MKSNFKAHAPRNASAPKPTPAKTADSSNDPEVIEQDPLDADGKPKKNDPTRFGDWSVSGRCVDF